LTARSEARYRDIGLESQFLYTPPAFDAPVKAGGGRWNIAIPFGTEKLEWCDYPTVKKFEDMFIRFDMINERDGRTDTA